MNKQHQTRPGDGRSKKTAEADNRKNARLLSGPNGNFHQLLRKLRKDAGYRSAIAFSEAVKVHKNTQGMYEKSGDPKVDYLVSFSYLTQSPFWKLLAKRVLMGNAPEPHKRYVLNQVGPLFGQINEMNSRAVGTADEILEADPAANAGDVISACQKLLDDTLRQPAVKVFRQSGNSMSPTINEGDMLFIDTASKKLSDGDLFLLTFGQDHMTKRVQLLPSGGLILISDNPQYQPVSLTSAEANDLNIQGKLISSISSYK